MTSLGTIIASSSVAELERVRRAAQKHEQARLRALEMNARARRKLEEERDRSRIVRRTGAVVG